ncbi:MAG: MucB/RseB C-terminal domain-containing protein [Granulosicoccus sp.]
MLMSVGMVNRPGRTGWLVVARRAMVAAWVAGLGSSVSVAYAQESANGVAPAKLIQSMSQALRSLNYEGIFVHAQGSNLTGMHILHANTGRGEHERLTALDGEAREVIRNNSLVTCIWPGSQSVVVSKSKPREALPRFDASLATSQRYTFSYGKPDRVADRPTHVINVVPRDKYRYGYRFWIDVENNMLLRSMLLEGPEKPVEQVIFTEISFPNSIDIARFNFLGGESRDVVSWLEPKSTQAVSSLETREKSEQADRVGFASLPDGYRKVSETYSSTPIKNGPVSHVMLSDGMASVSVYVEYVSATKQAGSSVGLSRMGAMNAFSVSSESMMITAVGEVPEATVRAIAAAVKLKE